jgi:hypothetical protein
MSFSLCPIFYIDIIPDQLEIARAFFGFLCQEILTKLLVILIWFGMAFANANIVPKNWPGPPFLP